MSTKKVRTISVLVPKNPFAPDDARDAQHCLAALDVVKLMEWWPGKPHSPHRKAAKVKAIQRSLDWKRVAQIAAYLLQQEIIDAPDRLRECFEPIYEAKKNEPGRIWPPRVPRVVGFERSSYRVFSNVLLHVNGTTIRKLDGGGVANLIFDENDEKLDFSVIDGQHRINGAFFAITILREDQPNVTWEIPAEIFRDLDAAGTPPRRQAQIFIDVNFYQKKVDRSLVADLFPTARQKSALDDKERAQDLGRKLMLEIGPLVGMIQIPGIKYGVSDVVTLATLNSAIEDVIEQLNKASITTLNDQASFLAECLDAWLIASGRKEELEEGEKLSPHNVVYQGRILVSFVNLIPACIWELETKNIDLISDDAEEHLTAWLKRVLKRARLLENGLFIDKVQFKKLGYLGSGGIARFRDTLWCAVSGSGNIEEFSVEERAEKASKRRGKVLSALAKNDDDSE